MRNDLMKENESKKTVIAEREENFLCLSCMQPNEADEKICVYCDAPLHHPLSTDPLQVAYGEGKTYGKTVSAKPKPIVVFGVWITFLPTFVVSIGVVIETLLNRNSSTGLILFLITLFLSIFSFIMLFRITKNYFLLEKFDHAE